LLRAILERSEEDAKRVIVDMGYVRDPSNFDFRPTLAMVWIARLRARVQCRDSFLPLLYPDGRRVPPPYSDAELRRFGPFVAD
jgi:hypothetical protein